MKDLKIDGTVQTPTIHLTSNGLIEISGRSIPEDPNSFYQPILEWMDQYVQNPPKNTEINFNFEYINTSSSKTLQRILHILNKGYKNNNMKIYWHYEEGDDDMYELGRFFEPYINIPMHFVETEE